jgi:hypothetical protein
LQHRLSRLLAGRVPRPFGPVVDRAAVHDALGLVRLLWAAEKGHAFSPKRGDVVRGSCGVI